MDQGMQHLFAPGHILEIQPLHAPLAHKLVALDSDGVQGSIRGIVPEQLGGDFGMRLRRQGLHQQGSASIRRACFAHCPSCTLGCTMNSYHRLNVSQPEKKYRNTGLTLIPRATSMNCRSWMTSCARPLLSYFASGISFCSCCKTGSNLRR